MYVGETQADWPPYLGPKTEGLSDCYRLAYRSHEYVRRTWPDHFEILLIKEQGLNFEQDALVCRKRAVHRSSLVSRLWRRGRE